jgi:acetyltransferase-like isoleucine patch superfamily enzyme
MNPVKAGKKIASATFRWIASFISPNGLRVMLWRWSGASIGRDVYIGKNFLNIQNPVEPNRLFIEDRAVITYNVTIITESSPICNVKTPSHLRDYGVAVHGNVRIMHDSWIGTGAIILPNVTVHELSIVGAGSVVTRDVPPRCVVAGVPARVIRQLDKKP